jgi:subfamily B ATP-binding cassette protein MsbA
LNAESAAPFLSIIVPTRGRPERAAECVARILRSHPGDFELLLVDQSEGPETLQAVAADAGDPRFRHIRSSTRGAASARNVGIQHARGGILAFTDDDCDVSLDWVAAMHRIFALDESVDVVFGRVFVPNPPPGGWAARFDASPRELPAKGYPSLPDEWGISANMACRREVFEKVGMFDPVFGPGAPLRAAEDFDLFIRMRGAGVRIVNAREVTVDHVGYREGHALKVLMRGYYFSAGAVLMKHARLGELALLGIFGRLAATLLGRVLGDLFRSGRPTGAMGLLYLLLGGLASFRYAIDGRSRLFVERSRRGPAGMLWSYTRRHTRLAALALVFGFLGALFNGVGITLVVPLFMGFLGETVRLDGAPMFLQSMLGAFDAYPPQQRQAFLFAVVLSSFAIKNVTAFVSAYAAGRLRREITCDMRDEAVRIAVEVDVDFYSRIKLGDYIQRISWETLKGASAVLVVLHMVVSAVGILVLVGLMLALSWQLTLAALLLLGVAAAANQALISRARRLGTLLSERSSEYSHALLETLTGIRLVKSAGAEEAEARRVSGYGRAREEIELRGFLTSVGIGPVSELSMVLVLCATVVFGRLFFEQQLTGLSTVLLTFLLILFRMLPLVTQFNAERSSYASLSGASARLAELLSRSDKPFMQSGSRQRGRLQHEIRFDHAAFSYPGRGLPVLRDIDLVIPAGSTLALVGASGAGKTTAALLLTRFYDPTAGRVSLDGIDLRDFELHGLRRSIGIVGQDTFLFNTSVRGNIAYARPDATDEAICEAARRANALDFIDALPHGLDTQIGDRGIALSGGQRQRIAIARALLQDADILILDEATSALDTVSERSVQDAIESVRRGRTTLIIAHRLSTLDAVDRIAVLEDGAIVELGTHAELMRVGGYYARLRAMQSTLPAEGGQRSDEPAGVKVAV